MCFGAGLNASTGTMRQMLSDGVTRMNRKGTGDVNKVMRKPIVFFMKPEYGIDF
jgi:hypothetical protein